MVTLPFPPVKHHKEIFTFDLPLVQRSSYIDTFTLSAFSSTNNSFNIPNIYYYIKYITIYKIFYIIINHKIRKFYLFIYLF